METSTPIASPLRRKLSMRKNLVEIEQDEVANEMDVQHRRQEAINKSTNQKRRSVAPPLSTGLNAAQLAQHCKDCIQLSTENKINSKNAFSFLLIDFMAVMTKKEDSEISKNFNVATCTLDASVKIYGYRVDAVHTDAVKMSGGFFGKELAEALDNGNDDGVSEEEGEDGKAKVKPTKRRRKTTIVASSTLNAKSESEALLDAAPKKTLLSRNADGTQLLTRVPKYNDACLLMVDADVPCWPFDVNETAVPKFAMGDTFDPEEVMAILRDVPVNPGDKLSEVVSSIEFGRDIAEESELEATQTSVFEFDVNASVDDADNEEPLPPPRVAVPCGGYDSGEDIAVPRPLPQRPAPASLIEMKSRLSAQNMEYSIFDGTILKAWAGPTYWKVQPSRAPHPDNKENEEASHVVGAKRTRRTRVKEVVELFQVPEDVLARHLAPSNKCQLSKAALVGWNAAAVTLAEDYKYTPKHLFTLFHLPLTVIETHRDKSVLEDEAEDCDDPGEAGEELEYCTSQIMDDDPCQEPLDSSGMEVEAWNAENMVAVPAKVEKIAVGALNRRKHVDIRHLKRCIWDVLRSSSNANTSGLSFNHMLTTCPTKLPRSLASCMSAPLLFNAVLHLTNERCLTLVQRDKKSDLMISQ